MHADPLKPLPRGDDWDKPIDRFEFPALDRRQGADPTWAETMDTLRAPRRRDQKPWEWRRESPIRPVVFHDTGTSGASSADSPPRGSSTTTSPGPA